MLSVTKVRDIAPDIEPVPPERYPQRQPVTSEHAKWREPFIPTSMKLMFAVLLCAAFLPLPSLRAQPPAQDPLLHWMDRIAQQLLDGRQRAVAEIRTAADAERRKRLVREKFLEILGGL